MPLVAPRPSVEAMFTIRPVALADEVVVAGPDQAGLGGQVHLEGERPGVLPLLAGRAGSGSLTPALLTRMSTGPRSARMRATVAGMADASRDVEHVAPGRATRRR